MGQALLQLPRTPQQLARRCLAHPVHELAQPAQLVLSRSRGGTLGLELIEESARIAVLLVRAGALALELVAQILQVGVTSQQLLMRLDHRAPELAFAASDRGQ